MPGVVTAEDGCVAEPAASSLVSEAPKAGPPNDAAELSEMHEMEPLPAPLYMREREDESGLGQKLRPPTIRSKRIRFRIPEQQPCTGALQRPWLDTVRVQRAVWLQGRVEYM